jgi:hypothetical protein
VPPNAALSVKAAAHLLIEFRAKDLLRALSKIRSASNDAKNGMSPLTPSLSPSGRSLPTCAMYPQPWQR